MKILNAKVLASPEGEQRCSCEEAHGACSLAPCFFGVDRNINHIATSEKRRLSGVISEFSYQNLCLGKMPK